jgi:hypothetical protein
MRGNRATEEQGLHGDEPGDVAGQPNVGAAGRDHAPADLAEREAGVLGGDAQIGSLHQLQRGKAVDGADDGLEDVVVDALGGVLVDLELARRDGRDHGVQIPAGAPRVFAGGRQDRHPEVVVFVEVAEGLVEVIHHLGREAVLLLGPVPRHDRNMAPLLVEEVGGITHGPLLR